MWTRSLTQSLQDFAGIRPSDGGRIVLRESIDDCYQVSRRAAEDGRLRLMQQQEKSAKGGSEQDTDEQRHRRIRLRRLRSTRVGVTLLIQAACGAYFSVRFFLHFAGFPRDSVIHCHRSMPDLASRIRK